VDEPGGVTRREAEVLAALGKRLTNAEIAAQLYLSERTVESHVSSLLRKLGAPNRLALGELASKRRPKAAAPLPAPLELLTDPDGYYGRTAEREQLRELWRSASEGVCRVGVVSGEAGIGKSRLVAELAAEVHQSGGRVLFGADFEDVQRPYEPFVQAIVTDAATLTDVELRARAATSAESIARVVPELAERLGVARDALVFDAASALTDSYAGLHGYLRRAAEAGPLLLVIEDVHWATTTTLDALHYIAAVGGHFALLVVLTTRDSAPDVHEAIAAFLSDLSRLPATERVALGGLDEQAVAELIGALGGSADPATTAAETGGNPLFVREVATGAGGGSLVSLLTRRNRLVDPETSGILDVGAALGAEFDAQFVARMLNRPLVEVIESLDEAEAAGLVARAAGETTRFRFVHALFRSVRYNAIPNAQRVVLHQEITRALAPLGADDRVVPELARHAAIAAPLGDAVIALDYSMRAATLAEQALAFDEAATHYRRALAVADLLEPPDPHKRLAVSIRLGEVMQGGGQPGYETVLVDAARLARQLGDAQALAEVGWAMVKYGGPRHPSRDAEFVAIAQEALRELGPAPTAARARTLAAASEDLCFTDPLQASVLAHEALAIARRLDDPTTLGHVLLSYRVSAYTPGNAQARHPTADELVAVGRQTGQKAFTMLGLFHRAVSCRAEGELHAANKAADAAVAMGGDRALPPTYAAAVTMFGATREALLGHLDLAEEIANEVWALESEGFSPMNWYGPVVLMVRHSQDRLVELLPLIEPAVEQPGIGEIYRAALSVAYATAGRTEEAQTILRSFAETGFSAVPRNFSWLASLLAFAETAELLADQRAANQLLDMLGPYSGLIADLPQTVIGPVDLAIAQVALTAGAVSLAGEAAARAAAASRQRDTPIFRGRELVRLAAARSLSGASPEEIEPFVGEARAIAAETKAALIERELEHYRL